MSTCHFRLQSQDTSVERVIAFGDEQLVHRNQPRRWGTKQGSIHRQLLYLEL